ncbi:unnamed protein product [Merluccius merluccius]
MWIRVRGERRAPAGSSGLTREAEGRSVCPGPQYAPGGGGGGGGGGGSDGGGGGDKVEVVVEVVMEEEEVVISSVNPVRISDPGTGQQLGRDSSSWGRRYEVIKTSAW